MPNALAEQHRRAQIAIRNQALRDLLRLWPSFDLEDIKRTWPALEAALLLLIRARGRQSSGLSVAFYRQNRDRANPRGVATPRTAVPTDEEIVTGLVTVGPANAGLQLARNRPLETVRAATLVNLSGEVARHVLNHGRETLRASLVADQRLNGVRVGVRRVTSGSPCDWCSQEASKTYPLTESFPAHMHCGCAPEPVYR